MSTLIYSHGHTDHIDGTKGLLRPGLEIIAEQGIAEFLHQRNDGARVHPTRTFTNETTLQLGSRTLVLRRDGFHSPEGDLIISLPAEKVMMAVDILAPE